MLRLLAPALLALPSAATAALTPLTFLVDPDSAACAAARAQFPQASFGELTIKTDAISGRTSYQSKGLSLVDWITYEVILVSDADTGQPPAPFVLQATYTVEIKGGVQPGHAFDSTSVLYILADSSRLTFRPSAYRAWIDASAQPLASYSKESLTYQVTPEQLAVLASALKVRVKLSSTEVKTSGLSNKLSRGAQAIVVGMACGFPEGAAPAPAPTAPARPM